MGANTMNRDSNPAILPGETQDFIEENTSVEPRLETNIMRRDLPLKYSKYSHAVDYLHSVESHIPKELVSSKNFTEIRDLANHFTGNLTSYFGFESRMSDPSARTDYMLAISSKRGEREKLAKLFKNRNLPEEFLKTSEWQHIGKFVNAWANPNSVVNKRILSLWFEFDTSDELSKVPIPSIFLHTKPLRADSLDDFNKCKSITRDIIPILTGKSVPKKVEECFLKCLKNLPEGALLLDVGLMLSRPETDMLRLVLNRMKPDQIIPYLKKIGWTDENNRLFKLIEELKKYVTRIVLQINIGEKVDSKIGIECRFFPDLYNKETGWIDFLDYLAEKGLCIQKKRSAFLQFPNSLHDRTNQEFSIDSYMPSVKFQEKPRANALVGYISHVKINYKPNTPLEAKGYLGVRLFGLKN